MGMRMFKYRLYPSKDQRHRLVSACIELKRVYNCQLESLINEYKLMGKCNISRFRLDSKIKDLGVDRMYTFSQCFNNVSKRLSDAYRAFFRRCKNGKAPGFPRFKSRVWSITYPQFGFRFKSNRRLYISKIGNVPIVLHRLPRGKAKTLTIKQDRYGNWFACFSCEVNSKSIFHKEDNDIGIDVGLNSYAVLSDGLRIDNPRYLSKSEDKIKALQVKMCGQKNGSNNRKQTRYKLAKSYIKISNQRHDFMHKVSCWLTKRYKSIVIEDLSIADMLKNHYLAKSINDASWGRFALMLSYKAVERGGEIIRVDPRNTSSGCNVCGNIQKMPLSKRTFECGVCGNTDDRDVNAAKNILKKYTAGRAGVYACGGNVGPSYLMADVDESRTTFDRVSIIGNPLV